jgi:hypothetical protein
VPSGLQRKFSREKKKKKKIEKKKIEKKKKKKEKKKTQTQMHGGGGSSGEKSGTSIIALTPFQKGVNLRAIVLRVDASSHTKAGDKVTPFVVADETAAVSLSVWDAPEGSFRPGDIIELRNGNTALFKDSLTVYANRHSRLERTGEFTLVHREAPNMSTFAWIKDQASGALVMVHRDSGKAVDLSAMRHDARR